MAWQDFRADFCKKKESKKFNQSFQIQTDCFGAKCFFSVLGALRVKLKLVGRNFCVKLQFTLSSIIKQIFHRYENIRSSAL